MAAVVDSSSQIPGRIVRPQAPVLTEQGAREILALAFPEEDRRRMGELAAKAQEGHLSDVEQDECRNYELIGHLLSLLHSRARLAFKQSPQ